MSFHVSITLEIEAKKKRITLQYISLRLPWAIGSALVLKIADSLPSYLLGGLYPFFLVVSVHFTCSFVD